MSMMQKKKKESNFPVFRRWNNKAYAVFNSLKLIVKIGVLMIAYLKFAIPEAMAVGVDSTSILRNIDLEEIEISSEQLPETYSNISRVVVTITQNEIEQSAITSVNELLEYAANIDIRQRGTNGIQADISIRGSSFDQLLILLNGVNITDPQTGHHNLNLPLDLAAIERIEILKGPGSWKFGPGAFGGAINIITKTSENSFIHAGIEGGQYSTFSEKLSAGLKTGNFNQLLSVNNSSSKGYVDNTDYRISDIYYRGTLRGEQTETSFQVGYTDKGFGANSFYTAKYPEQYEATQTLFTSISLKTVVSNIQIEPKVYFRRNNDRFSLFRQNPERSTNYHTTDVWGSNILVSYFHGESGITTVGFDTRTETIWSNSLGELSQNPVKSPVNDTISLTNFHSRTNFSSFIGHKRYFSNLTVNVGVNFTRNSDLNFKWFIYPGIDLSYQLSKASSLFASVNKTMRMPTYTDLYYKGPANEGNPNLLPEEAVGYEFGFQNKSDLLKFSLTGFYSQGKNMIDWVKDDLADKWKTINYTSLNTVGAEVSINADFKKIFPEQTILKTVKVDYTFLDQNKMKTNLISNYSLNYLKHRIDFSLTHSIWKNIQANWHVTYQDRNGQYEKIVEKVSSGLVNFEPFIVCDLKISSSFSGWTLYGSVNNLFNNSYFDIGNVVQPGRWLKIGLTKKIDFH
jgi:iron complex outermembrane receptor protein